MFPWGGLKPGEQEKCDGGIERQKIFRDDSDRDDFLGRLGKILSETSTLCYAWALISNHALC